MATKSKKKLGKQTLALRCKALQPPVPIFQPLINWKKLFGRSLMAFGAFIIVGTIFLTQMAYISPDKQSIVLSKEISTASYPVSLEIKQPFTRFDLEKGNLKYGLWPLSDAHPVYLETSGTPGKNGN